MNNNKESTEVPKLIFEDDDLLIINKPAGLLSIPDGYNPDLPHLRLVLEPVYGPLWMVHRLDKETSGVVVLAKNEDAHRELNHLFRSRQVEKIYHGLVTPAPKWQKMIIDFPLLPNADRNHRTRVNNEKGKEALTISTVMKRYPCGVLMEFEIQTGITHQIRAHLRSLELSLIGETNYNAGLPPHPIQADRLMLHARKLGFTHPNKGTWQCFTAPYPEDFRSTYTKLRITTIQDDMTLWR